MDVLNNIQFSHNLKLRNIHRRWRHNTFLLTERQANTSALKKNNEFKYYFKVMISYTSKLSYIRIYLLLIAQQLLAVIGMGMSCHYFLEWVSMIYRVTNECKISDKITN